MVDLLRALGARSHASTRDIDRPTAAHVEWIQMLQTQDQRFAVLLTLANEAQ